MGRALARPITSWCGPPIRPRLVVICLESNAAGWGLVSQPQHTARFQHLAGLRKRNVQTAGTGHLGRDFIQSIGLQARVHFLDRESATLSSPDRDTGAEIFPHPPHLGADPLRVAKERFLHGDAKDEFHCSVPCRPQPDVTERRLGQFPVSHATSKDRNLLPHVFLFRLKGRQERDMRGAGYFPPLQR